MKRIITIISVAVLSTAATAQVISTTILEQNDVRASIANNGSFFNNIATATPGYEMPKNSGRHSIFTINALAFGKDVNGQLKGAAANYNNTDFYPGPVANQPYSDYGIWHLTKAAVDHHIAHWNDPGYNPIPEIANWPGNGNVMNGEALRLAPFADLNGDLFYNPLDGDYPLIRGDEAVYTIMNDAAQVHNSGSDPIRMELHLMFYQYATPDTNLYTTTFVQATLFNRGTQSIYDFHFGALVDFDLGNPFDDYIGTDPGRNLAYVYNGDLVDEAHNGTPGYGYYPPAFGFVTLNQALYSNVFLNNNTSYTPQGYYNLLSGIQSNGSDQLDNNGLPTPYTYSEIGNAGWNEVTAANPSGDRKSTVSFGSETFMPGGILCYDFAIIYAENLDGTIFGPVTHLQSVADDIRTFYDDQAFPCTASVLGTSEHSLLSLSAFPNPATDALHLNGIEHGTFRILSPDGKIIQSGTFTSPVIDLQQLTNGYYLLVVEAGTATQTIAFMK